MKTKDICSYFEQYGEIESIGLTIRFKDKIDANKVLQCHYHKVGNYILTAEPPRELPIINDCKSVASPQKHILDLDDKCLMEIGGYLNDDQLVQISASCVRFKGIADKVFASKYKGIFEVDLRKKSVAENEHIFKWFGTTIDTLTIISEFYDGYFRYQRCTEMPETLQLASDYCSQTLRELHVKDESYSVWEGLTVNYPKLERLYWNIELDNLWNEPCECPNLSKFISPLPRLKELICTGYMLLTSQTLTEIVENCPKLEKFCYKPYYDEEVKFTEEMMTTLCKLKSLSSLHISRSNLDIMSLLNGLWMGDIPLECLDLSAYDHDVDDDGEEIIIALSKLKRIKKLNMPNFKVKIKHLTRLVKSLPLLEELELRLYDKCECLINGLQETLRNANQLKKFHFYARNYSQDKKWEINTAGYQILANVVKRRIEKRKLSIKIRGDIDINYIDTKAVKHNYEWFEISMF